MLDTSPLQSPLSISSPMPPLLTPQVPPTSVKPFPTASSFVRPSCAAVCSLFKSSRFQLCCRAKFGFQLATGLGISSPAELRLPSGTLVSVGLVSSALVLGLDWVEVWLGAILDRCLFKDKVGK